jgi:putative FmdB family regulatory protein
LPLYEYECEKCGSRFEKIESVSASTVKKCPKCGGKAQRLLAAPAIQFKGSGWYVTDYAGKNSSAAGEKPAEGASAEKAASGDGDAKKPAAAKEKPAKTKRD